MRSKKIKKYLTKYVLEFFVIVMGITFSFFVQNIRNDIQIDTKRELIIDNLLSELESNQAYIDDKKQVFRREMEYVNKLLLDSLTTQEIKKYPKNLSPLNPFFSVNKFRPSRSVYNSIVNDGSFNIIEPSSLKVLIDEVYSINHNTIINIIDSEQKIADKADEFFVKNYTSTYVKNFWFNYDWSIISVYTQKLQNHNLLFGATYRHTIYDDNTPATEEREKTLLPGLFIQDQLTLSKLETLLFGIRYDNNSIYGDIWTPRINYKLSSKDESSIIRLGFGTGYRVVNVFTEDHAALTGARDVIFLEDILPEKSWNLNFNWNKKIYTKHGTIFDMDFSVFNTVFSNKIIPDYDTNPNQIIYGNLDGKGVTQGATINLNSLFANGLKIIMGATFIDSKVTNNNTNEYPYLTEKFSANYKISYSLFKPKIAFDLSGTIIGPMKLPLLGDLDTRDPYSPLINIINFRFK